MQRPTARKRACRCRVEIIDDGPGLPPDIADDVFEPFVSGKENGTGLGLALVSKLIGDAGGWISVDSVPGRTAFRVSLPVVPRKIPNRRSSKWTGPFLSPTTTARFRTVLTQALTRAGCKVHATSSLVTLMRWVEEGKGDLVISDVVMPDGNGLEQLPKIAAARPGPAGDRDLCAEHDHDCDPSG